MRKDASDAEFPGRVLAISKGSTSCCGTLVSHSKRGLATIGIYLDKVLVQIQWLTSNPDLSTKHALKLVHALGAASCASTCVVKCGNILQILQTLYARPRNASPVGGPSGGSTELPRACKKERGGRMRAASAVEWSVLSLSANAEPLIVLHRTHCLPGLLSTCKKELGARMRAVKAVEWSA